MRPNEISTEVNNAFEILRKGGIILYPTDTVWGLGCDATNDEAVEKIFTLKQRSESKSMILLLDTENKLMRYVKEVPEHAWDLIEYTEKPLTIIYDCGLNVSKKVLAADGSVGIRITKDEFCKQLIAKLGKPLVSTSANLSGNITPSIFNDIDPAVLQGVDYVVNLRQNDTTAAKPSVIIKMSGNGTIRFIRK